MMDCLSFLHYQSSNKTKNNFLQLGVFVKTKGWGRVRKRGVGKGGGRGQQ